MTSIRKNIETITEKLTTISTSLETIAGAINGGTLKADPALIDAISALQFNAEELYLGDIAVKLTGRSLTIGEP